MGRAQRPGAPDSLPQFLPPSPPCSLPGLSAESGWSTGRDPEYLAPPRLLRGTLRGREGGREGGREADLKRLNRHTSENIFQETTRKIVFVLN